MNRYNWLFILVIPFSLVSLGVFIIQLLYSFIIWDFVVEVNISIWPAEARICFAIFWVMATVGVIAILFPNEGDSNEGNL